MAFDEYVAGLGRALERDLTGLWREDELDSLDIILAVLWTESVTGSVPMDATSDIDSYEGLYHMYVSLCSQGEV